MSTSNSRVDAFLKTQDRWQEEFKLLRAIVQECNLTEDLKWGQPCYTLDGKNSVLIHGLKEYCAWLIFKGVLLKDPKGLLIQQTENVQSGRQIRFTSTKEIVKLKTVIKSYIKEAIEIEKSGIKVEHKKSEDFPVPTELTAKFKTTPALKKAFNALTPGRQRAYLLFFAGAKQSKTRQARIDKSIPQIMAGKGLND